MPCDQPIKLSRIASANRYSYAVFYLCRYQFFLLVLLSLVSLHAQLGILDPRGSYEVTFGAFRTSALETIECTITHNWSIFYSLQHRDMALVAENHTVPISLSTCLTCTCPTGLPRQDPTNSQPIFVVHIAWLIWDHRSCWLRLNTRYVKLRSMPPKVFPGLPGFKVITLNAQLAEFFLES